MMKKKIIFNADDYGISNDVNDAIIECFKDGILTSTSIMSNGEAFDKGVLLLEDCEDLDLGIHLNIIEGKTLCNSKENSMLYDVEGNYNNGYLQLLLKSYNNTFLKEVEDDFRVQIEKVLNYKKATRIDSHVHTHAIPNIFKITCELAQEYGIESIRTQHEKPYFVKSIKKHLSPKYPINLIKLCLLNTFTHINKQTLKKYNLKTNDYFIGVTYTGYMDKNTIIEGLKAIPEKKCVTEVIFHPTKNQAQKDNYTEYVTAFDNELKELADSIMCPNNNIYFL